VAELVDLLSNARRGFRLRAVKALGKPGSAALAVPAVTSVFASSSSLSRMRHARRAASKRIQQ
jgi:hypothetical protein